MLVDQPAVPWRRTLYRGIRMRSRLEATFAGFLDREHFAWRYEPEAYATERGQYLPDFEIAQVASPFGWTEPGGWGPRPLFVEIKGEEPDAWAGLRARMEIILASSPGAQLAIACAGLIVRTGRFPLWWAHLPASPSQGRWHNGAVGRCADCGVASFYPFVGDVPWFVCRSCGCGRPDAIDSSIDPLEPGR